MNRNSLPSIVDLLLIFLLKSLSESNNDILKYILLEVNTEVEHIYKLKGILYHVSKKNCHIETL